MSALNALPQVIVATDVEVMALIGSERLYGLGVGFVDAHLIAATRLTPGVRLWALDRRLSTVADCLRLDASSAP